jgi:hypothetical protein
MCAWPGRDGWESTGERCATGVRTSRNAVSLSSYRGQRRAEHDEHAGAMRRGDRIKEPLHDDPQPGPMTTPSPSVDLGARRRPTEPRTASLPAARRAVRFHHWIRMLSPGPPSRTSGPAPLFSTSSPARPRDQSQAASSGQGQVSERPRRCRPAHRRPPGESPLRRNTWR